MAANHARAAWAIRVVFDDVNPSTRGVRVLGSAAQVASSGVLVEPGDELTAQTSLWSGEDEVIAPERAVWVELEPWREGDRLGYEFAYVRVDEVLRGEVSRSFFTLAG
jgi:hypothetical protein